MGSRGDDQAQIPVIDISESNVSAPEQLLDAATRYGFVFVANNEAGVPRELTAKLFDVSREFFASPTEVKEQVSIASNKAGKNHGWLSQGVEKLDPATQKRPDVKEAFNLSLPDQAGHYDQPLPQILQTNSQTLSTFQNACSTLCQRILTHLATALRLPPDWFTTRHDRTKGPSGTVFRLLYYPHRSHPNSTSDDKDIDIRAGAHSDYGSITLLFQLPGQPGLELLTPEGSWAAVPCDPLGRDDGNLPILVNIGDLLEDWTDGLLKSTKHRVVFPSQEAGDRYSMAYFCHPLDEALLEPVPSEVVREYAARSGKASERSGKVITARDHLMNRLAATYSIK